MLSAEKIIDLLALKPLSEEGGYYRETYRAREPLSEKEIIGRTGHTRNLSTAIYYLLTPDTKSALHRLPFDEIFHFYLGDPVRMLLLHPDGVGETVILGSDILSGQRVQMVVPRDVWQGSMLIEGGQLALMGTTMSPGFDFEDYEAGQEEKLVRTFPEYGDIIKYLSEQGQ